MLQRLTLLIVVLFLGVSCQKEKISIGAQVSDTFYLDNHNASMRITVEGNTSGETFLILVHGGPGESSYFYSSDYIRQNLENNLALVYWDQRNAGASQGNSNGNNLTLEQMTDDLKKLVQLIKGRYGQSSSIFILGHSFGGLLTTSFMVNPENQAMVKGWIVVDGSHNYALNDTLTREKLLATANQQIQINDNTGFWNGILNWCDAYTGNFSLDESGQLESFAQQAEEKFPQVKYFDVLSWIVSNTISEDVPLSSFLFNYLYSSQAELNNELYHTNFSADLHSITLPSLLLYGAYDFICPSELGQDLLNRIGSTDKKMIISPISGHNLIYQDENLFCKEVNEFIKLYR